MLKKITGHEFEDKDPFLHKIMGQDTWATPAYYAMVSALDIESTKHRPDRLRALVEHRLREAFQRALDDLANHPLLPEKKP